MIEINGAILGNNFRYTSGNVFSPGLVGWENKSKVEVVNPIDPLRTQYMRLVKTFPHLGKFAPQVLPAIKLYEEAKIPEGAEGWTIIFDWTEFADNYKESIKILRQKNLVVDLVPYNNSPLPGREFVFAWDYIKDYLWPSSNFAIIPVQFGQKRKTENWINNKKILSLGEFGLGEFQVLQMLIANPKRLDVPLAIAVPGDEYLIDMNPPKVDKKKTAYIPKVKEGKQSIPDMSFYRLDYGDGSLIRGTAMPKTNLDRTGYATGFIV